MPTWSSSRKRDQVHPPSGCKVIQMGEDPLFRDLPMRSFRADATLVGSPAQIFNALLDRIQDDKQVGPRHDRLLALKSQNSASAKSEDEAAMPTPRDVTLAIAKVCAGVPVFK